MPGWFATAGQRAVLVQHGGAAAALIVGILLPIPGMDAMLAVALAVSSAAGGWRYRGAA